jgi:hypothetical protein
MKGKSVRRSRGELDHPDGIESRRTAWARYLGIAAQVNPKVLKTLLTEEAIARAGARLSQPPDAITSARHYRETSNLAHIRDWCEHWAFLPEWAEGPASDTLAAAWRSRTEGLPSPAALDVSSLITLAPGTVLLGNATKTGLQLDIPAFDWTPTREPYGDAKNRIMGLLDTLVSTELNRIKSEMLDRGYVQPGVKYSAVDHYIWFAKAWLNGESADTIANDSCGDDRRDARAVRRAMRDVREALGLTTRLRSWRSRP